MGRPEADISRERLVEMLDMNYKLHQVAAHFGVHRKYARVTPTLVDVLSSPS
jgi:hypothetical protein